MVLVVAVKEVSRPPSGIRLALLLIVPVNASRSPRSPVSTKHYLSFLCRAPSCPATAQLDACACTTTLRPAPYPRCPPSGEPGRRPLLCLQTPPACPQNTPHRASEQVGRGKRTTSCTSSTHKQHTLCSALCPLLPRQHHPGCLFAEFVVTL